VPERLPNELLASWFTRSGWSKGELARVVNRRARDLGAAHVATDTSRVRRWLDGEQPRDPIPRILTELFSERFNCVVTLGDLGLREPAGPIAGALTDLPWSAQRTAELLADFCRSDLILGSRGAGGAPPLAAGPALIEPVRRWLLPAPPAHMAQAPHAMHPPPLQPPHAAAADSPEAPGEPVHTTAARAAAHPGTPASVIPITRPRNPSVSASRTVATAAGQSAAAAGPDGAPVPTGRTQILIEQLEEAARTFRAWHAEAGGGVRRAAVVGQLYEVAEAVRQLPEGAHPHLLHSAAQFAVLAGEMAFDCGMQATAQRYLILALHAAKEAGDRALVRGTLAVMSRQLIHLGRPQDALDLLAVGQGGAAPGSPPGSPPGPVAGPGAEPHPLVVAYTETVAARAHGALGRPDQCRHAAERAKAAHFRASSRGGGPSWLGDFNSAALHGELGRALLDLADRVAAAAPEALAEFEAAAELYERQQPDQLRGRVAALAGLAEARAMTGDGGTAARSLRAAVALAVRLRSRHTEELLRETASRAAQRLPRDPALRDLADRLRDSASAPPPPPTVFAQPGRPSYPYPSGPGPQVRAFTRS
jgi:hypothetical protein